MIITREDGTSWNKTEYEWKTGSVTVAGTTATTNIKDDSDFTNLFNTVKRAHYIKITVSGTAYVRINSATADVMTLTETVPFECSFMTIEKLFISTNNQAVTFTIVLA